MSDYHKQSLHHVVVRVTSISRAVVPQQLVEMPKASSRRCNHKIIGLYSPQYHAHYSSVAHGACNGRSDLILRCQEHCQAVNVAGCLGLLIL
jgi:hypothetical protein